MIRIEGASVHGFKEAIRGMRNPYNSHRESDSYQSGFTDDGKDGFVLGRKDEELAMRLAKAGPDHAKYRRMICAYADITAPIYWWEQMSTYKVGTVFNSESKMHTLGKRILSVEDFSHEGLIFDWEIKDGDDKLTVKRQEYMKLLEKVIDTINTATAISETEGNKNYWDAAVKLMPMCFNQKRTAMLSYETLANIYRARRGHKLDEWRDFCKWIESLPYSELITLREGGE